jgi:hypothetical protein
LNMINKLAASTATPATTSTVAIEILDFGRDCCRFLRLVAIIPPYAINIETTLSETFEGIIIPKRS